MVRSLSSIPTGEQRSLEAAMQEVADWMALPGNEREFIVLFFDDQKDLSDWVRSVLCLRASSALRSNWRADKAIGKIDRRANQTTDKRALRKALRASAPKGSWV